MVDLWGCIWNDVQTVREYNAITCDFAAVNTGRVWTCLTRPLMSRFMWTTVKPWMPSRSDWLQLVRFNASRQGWACSRRGMLHRYPPLPFCMKGTKKNGVSLLFHLWVGSGGSNRAKLMTDEQERERQGVVVNANVAEENVSSKLVNLGVCQWIKAALSQLSQY